MSELDDVQTTVAVIDGLRSRIAKLEAENADLRGLLLVIGSSHPHLVPRIDAYLAARVEEGREK